VEINYTFYRMPNATTVAGWDAGDSAGFTFVLKAPQRITGTSPAPGRWTTRYATSLKRDASWAPSSGPFLFQLPPNFKKDRTR